MNSGWYRRAGKRMVDLGLAVPGVILLSPLMACIALAVRCSLGSPVLFRQKRPGFRMRPFTALKFRTMRNARGAQGRLLPDSDRITPLGRLLRRTSLDELPGLFNVLRGEMSLVGPRPLLMRYLPYFTNRERARFEVRPGITGWAQIRGRNNLDWNERFNCDVWYVENLSLWLDLKIIVLTIARVLRREDVRTLPHLTMPDLDEERAKTINAGT